MLLNLSNLFWNFSHVIISPRALKPMDLTLTLDPKLNINVINALAL